jgi:hypothetical protein
VSLADCVVFPDLLHLACRELRCISPDVRLLSPPRQRASPTAPALAKAACAGTQAPASIHRKAGAFEVTVLSDGFVPSEPKIFTGDAAGTAKLLDSAFLPKGAFATSVNEWLVNAGDKLVLIDTGTSNVHARTLDRTRRTLRPPVSNPLGSTSSFWLTSRPPPERSVE